MTTSAAVTAGIIRLRTLTGTDFLLAIGGLALTQVRIHQAGAGWPWASVWVAAMVAVAPALLAVRSVAPVAAAVGCMVAAQASLLLGEIDWVLLAGVALALWSAASRRWLGTAVATLLAATVLVPLLVSWRWLDLAGLGAPADQQLNGVRVLPVLDPASWNIESGNWPWWISAALVLVWAVALLRRYRHGLTTDWADRASVRERIDELRAYLDRGDNRVAADVVLAVAVVNVTLLAVRRGEEIAVVIDEWSAAGIWPLVLAYAPLILVLRRIRPVIPCVLLAGTSYLAYYWVVQDTWPLLAGFVVALYSLAAHRPLRTAVLVAAAILALLPVAGALPDDGTLTRLIPGLKEAGWPEYDSERHWPVTLSLILALPVCLGVLARMYRRGAAANAREAALRRRAEEQDAEQRRLTERAHIARDLHDVIAHNVTLMVIQAEAGPDLLRRGEAELAFRRIGDAGRQALGELDRMLSALRDENGVADPQLAPQPGLADLGRLAAGVDRPDLAVELDVRGHLEDVPDGHQLTAYRIVQEALTNVVRHARAAQARVLIRVIGNGLAVEVTDDGSGFRPDDVRDAGRHGLAGMRERVRVHDGTLTVRSEPGQGTEVTAWLPLP